ncbi:pentapeptide repeat-containing protein [Mycolicibacterium poriferae]|nr:pentapeptide repeat-containing protein [Mycolicibacterium poriferae]
MEAGGGTREGECHGSRGDPGSASDQACCVTHLAEALRAADLRAVDLRGDDLRGVDFWGVDLRGVDFWGVDFWGVDFWGAVAGRAASAPLDR